MGQLIVFEGIDGSGKTSLARLFLAHLLQGGTTAIGLREPTDSPLGEKIRRLAQDREVLALQKELDLFLQDRRWDVETNILPALRAGTTVVLDRYYYSNACYQGARGLDREEILRTNRAFAPEPDIVFIIDVDVERALERISLARQGVAKLFEKREFLEKVRANYLALSGANLVLIDGNPELETVLGDVLARFGERNRAATPPAWRR